MDGTIAGSRAPLHVNNGSRKEIASQAASLADSPILSLQVSLSRWVGRVHDMSVRARDGDWTLRKCGPCSVRTLPP